MLSRVGLVTGAAVGVSAWQMTKVHAANEPEQRKKIRPSELPVYGDPDPPELEFIPEKETSFHRKVSEVRKWTWHYLDSVQDTTNKVKDKYEVAKAHTTGALTYIQEDSGVLPRVAIITVSGLGGIVAGYKGGIIRKTVLAATAMAAAASVCYPHEAVVVGKEGWRLATDFTSTTYQDLFGSSTTKKPQKNIQESPKKTEPSEKPESVSAATTPGPKMDFGMSKPEDKDMYTTRGN
jgi:hypothetical protein